MANPFDSAQGRPIVSLQEIHKGFRQANGERVDVLTGVDLWVKPGEIVAIVGPSGSGKSTLLHIAGLMEKPDRGVVEILGRVVDYKDNARCDRLRRESISFLFQFDSLLEELTLEENFKLVTRLRQKNNGNSAQITSLFERLGLKGKAGSYPGSLSSGEKTRANILRSLVGRPKLLLADEPTGNLDPKNAKQVADEFISLARGSGGETREPMAIILVTHNMEMAQLADSVYRLQNGRLEKNR